MTAEKSYGRTPSGVETTEECIEKAVAEAEAGYDISKLQRRPGRPSMGDGPAAVLPVRLDPELRRALDARAEAEETTVSAVVRDALREYLRAGCPVTSEHTDDEPTAPEHAEPIAAAAARVLAAHKEALHRLSK